MGDRRCCEFLTEKPQQGKVIAAGNDIKKKK